MKRVIAKCIVLLTYTSPNMIFDMFENYITNLFIVKLIFIDDSEMSIIFMSLYKKHKN